MKRIFFLITTLILVLPSFLKAEVIILKCKTREERMRNTQILERGGVFSEWRKTEFVYNFELNEGDNYANVHFPNTSSDRGTKLADFRAELVIFDLPVRELEGEKRFIIDRYEINRLNGNFSRIYKMFNSEKNWLTFEWQVKGKCKKSNIFSKTFF